MELTTEETMRQSHKNLQRMVWKYKRATKLEFYCPAHSASRSHSGKVLIPLAGQNLSKLE